MKSNRLIIIVILVFVCVCLTSLTAAGFIYLRNRPPSSVTSSSGYYVRGSHVYYLGGFPSTAFAIDNADVKTFNILDSQYALDNTHVYFNGSLIPDADPASFELLDSPFSRDAQHVYVSGTVFTNDPANFEILTENVYRDSQHIYWSTEIISDDPSNLEILHDENYYTYVKDSTTVFVNGNSIQGADSDSFEVILDGYARDAAHIFYFGGIIPDADSATFEILESPYAKDGNSVFWMEHLIEGVDVSTFQVLNADFECSADSTTAYYQDQPIPNFDPNSIPADSHVTNCDINGMYFSP